MFNIIKKRRWPTIIYVPLIESRLESCVLVRQQSNYIGILNASMQYPFKIFKFLDLVI